jgi:hypothetical protein
VAAERPATAAASLQPRAARDGTPNGIRTRAATLRVRPTLSGRCRQVANHPSCRGSRSGWSAVIGPFTASGSPYGLPQQINQTTSALEEPSSTCTDTRVTQTIDRPSPERSLVAISHGEPVAGRGVKGRVVGAWAVADPALGLHVAADGVRVEPQVVERGSHVARGTGGVRPNQTGFSMGPSKWLRTAASASVIGDAGVTVQWGASSVGSSGKPDAMRSAPCATRRGRRVVTAGRSRLSAP